MKTDFESEADEILPWLQLMLAPDIGPAIAHRLLQAFGRPREIFEASFEKVNRIDGLGERRLESLFSKKVGERARRELDRSTELGIRMIHFGSTDYPANLLRLPNPPLVLYVQGEITPEDRLAIAIVGPRKPSDYARIMTRQLAPALCARGLTIVSGLAYGIDAEAHLAAVQSGGRTLGVLAQGLDTPLFPSSNRTLARRIIEEQRGAILSTFPLDVKPEPHFFPNRNEIIAGLSLGTLIVEASERSGALITANHAMELDRTVMACPGDATRANSRGSNRLIAEGAILVQTHDDILRALATELQNARNELGESQDDSQSTLDSSSAVKSIAIAPADSLEARICELLSDPRSIDYLLETLAEDGYGQGKISEKLLMMEMSGRVRQMPGRIYSRVD